MTADINYSNPTRIQRAAIPVLLAGRDALVNAPTGSGKTLAYLAPLINDLQARIQPTFRRGVVTPACHAALQDLGQCSMSPVHVVTCA